MTDKEELQNLLAVLKKYDLPVSPILEYAIKEKIDQLSSKDEGSNAVPIIKFQENDGMMDVSVQAPIAIKKKPSSMQVIRANGTIIENEKVASTFCQAIKEIGVEKIYAMKIPMDGMQLVTIGGNPQYPTAQHDMGGGYFVNVHSNTKTKKRQLERIFSALSLNWRVEIIESY